MTSCRKSKFSIILFHWARIDRRRERWNSIWFGVEKVFRFFSTKRVIKSFCALAGPSSGKRCVCIFLTPLWMHRRFDKIPSRIKHHLMVEFYCTSAFLLLCKLCKHTIRQQQQQQRMLFFLNESKFMPSRVCLARSPMRLKRNENFRFPHEIYVYLLNRFNFTCVQVRWSWSSRAFSGDKKCKAINRK